MTNSDPEKEGIEKLVARYKKALLDADEATQDQSLSKEDVLSRRLTAIGSGITTILFLLERIYGQESKRAKGDSAESAQQLLNKPALTTSQAAKLLGVSEGTMRRWGDDGDVDIYRTPGGQRRFITDSLRKVMEPE